MYIPSLLRGRITKSPCPQANGSQIGSPLAFKLICGTAVNGLQIATTQAGSMDDCLSQCTDYHGPRCDGVQFTSAGQCIMLANVDEKDTTISPKLDSAIAQLPNPGPVSDCNLLGSGSVQTNIGKKFRLACNSVWNGDDYEQQFHMSIESCMGACASNATGCGGISYEIDQAYGFNNCYLKTKAPATMDKLIQRANTDTAIMMLPRGDNGPGPVTTVVATITMSMAASTKVVMTTKIMTSLVPVTGIPSPEVSPTGAAEATEPGRLVGIPQNPPAKTAGVVIGALALVTLVALAIWFFRRQRRSSAPASSGFNATGRDEKAWQRQGGETRNQPGTPPLVRTETIITISSSREGSIRDSQNGLKQHQYLDPSANSRAAIPPDFAGPPPDGISR